MFSAVLFDMDGLIFDTEQVYKVSWQFAAEAMGVALTDEFYQTFIGVQDKECEKRLVDLYGDDFNIEYYRAIRNTHFDAERKKGIAFKQGFHNLFQLALDKNLFMALVTSSRMADVHSNFAGSRYLDQFDIIITAEDTNNGKPAPDCYQTACRRLKLSPSSCLVLEDSNNGVRAAKEAGCTVAMIPDLTPADHYANKNVDYLFKSLDDVAKLLG